MRDQLRDLVGGNAVAFHVDFHAHVGEADRLLAEIAGAPDAGDVEVALEREFEFAHSPAAMHGVGVQADSEAGAEGGERGFGRIGRCVVAEQARRLVDDVGGEIADVVGVTELALGDRLAFQGLDDLRIGLAGGDQAFETRLVDRREAARGDGGEATGENDFFLDRRHGFPPFDND